jgi:intracellular sulfur oxidation DsrE/DsrF family protein
MYDSVTPRRSFLARLAAGVAAFGAVPALAAVGCAPAAAPAPPASPPGDELDTWLGTMKAPNRVIYDCVQAPGAPDGIVFARNFLKFSQEKLGTKDTDMNVIVSFRHYATPYGYADAMWAKYPQFAALLKVDDPKTRKPAARNIPLHDDVEDQVGASLPALAARGVQFTVCGAATEFIAKLLAGKSGDAKAIEAELGANLIPNARMVPAGVVAVQRAQKSGFAYTFAG